MNESKGNNMGKVKNMGVVDQIREKTQRKNVQGIMPKKKKMNTKKGLISYRIPNLKLVTKAKAYKGLQSCRSIVKPKNHISCSWECRRV
jgi:hypothetical protein